MSTQIVVPVLGESVTEATVAKWLKQVGDSVAMDEPLVELETDKITLEVNAAAAGVISEISVQQGANVAVGALLGTISEGKGARPAPAANTQAAAQASAPQATPSQAAASAQQRPPAAAQTAQNQNQQQSKQAQAPSSPSARKIAGDNGIDLARVNGSGKDGRVMKEDVLAAAASAAQGAAKPAPAKAPAGPAGPRPRASEEERVRMTRLRLRVAERLKEAQNTAAMLTTFNEADMGRLMALRGQYKDSFEKKHGVKLGFMSFFVKACIAALKEIPCANAEIEGEEIVYKNYYDIGVAVGTENGLVVPVVRDADKLSFADVEKTIGGLGKKARDGKLAITDLMGGTFTISNGGVYGSLMSTPILNPPQSAILGMHKIQERPMVVNGKIEVRPMMYLALSYDHRIIDGREAVTFLVRVKDLIEDPERLLLDV